MLQIPLRANLSVSRVQSVRPFKRLSTTFLTRAGTVNVMASRSNIKVLYSEEQISARVKELAAEIKNDYEDKAPLILQVMCGAYIFAADLTRALWPSPAGTTIDCVRAKSYSGESSSGEVELSGLGTDVTGRHVLLVEDIVDTGNTQEKLEAAILKAGAASVKLCALLNKRARRLKNVQPHYEGFDCPDVFVVGYGMDYDGVLREIPFIGFVEEEASTKKN